MSSIGEMVNETVCDLNEKWRRILKRDDGNGTLAYAERIEDDEGEDVHGFGETLVCVHNEGIIVQITGEYIKNSRNLAKENKLRRFA